MILANLLDRAVAMSSRLWCAHGALLGLGLLSLYIVTVSAVAGVYPRANWDMVAYVASALDDGSRTATELHRAAWDAVRDRVSEGELAVLTSDRPYRVRQYADPNAFATMLGFYEVKFLYVRLASFLSRFMHPVDALHLISATSALAVGFLVLAWAWDRKFVAYAPFVLSLLVLSGYGEVAREAVPDLFASVFVVLAAWAYLRRFDLVCAVALLGAFLARPDHLAFIGVLAVVALMARQGAIVLLAVLVVALAAYFPLTRLAGHPGWWVQMWFTNVEYVPTLEGFSPPFSLLVYLGMLVRVVVRSLVEESWLAVLLLECIALGALVLRRARMEERETVLLLALLATVAAKFIVAPFHETRFHMAYLIVFGMTLLGVWARQQVPLSAERRAPVEA